MPDARVGRVVDSSEDAPRVENLAGADLRDADLDLAQLQAASVSKETRWPDGWDQARIVEAGVVFEGGPEAEVGSMVSTATES
jgi:hypothetical protein